MNHSRALAIEGVVALHIQEVALMDHSRALAIEGVVALKILHKLAL